MRGLIFQNWISKRGDLLKTGTRQRGLASFYGGYKLRKLVIHCMWMKKIVIIIKMALANTNYD